MNRAVLKQIKALQPGMLLRIDWFDASRGKTLMGGPIDIPVSSWGIYLGILGERNKHIILAHSNFKYTNGLYDIDYTAIPVSWSTAITVVNEVEVDAETAQALLKSFLVGRARRVKRRLKNHGS